mgnify:CR=1 FL=1
MPENRSVALGRRSKLTKQLIERICEQVEAGNLDSVRGTVAADLEGRERVHSAFDAEVGNGQDYVNTRNDGNLAAHDVNRGNQQMHERVETDIQREQMEQTYGDNRHGGFVLGSFS